MLALAPHAVRAVRPDDPATLAAMQGLLERCRVYFEEVEHAPVRPDEAVQLLAEVPPGHPLEHKHVLLVDDVALLDFLVGFPTPTIWYLGLVLVAPEARGRGLGEQLVTGLAAHARAQGATGLRLACEIQNTGARRLYDRLGFVPVENPRRQRTSWNGAVMDCDVLELAL